MVSAIASTAAFTVWNIAPSLEIRVREVDLGSFSLVALSPFHFQSQPAGRSGCSLHRSSEATSFSLSSSTSSAG